MGRLRRPVILENLSALRTHSRWQSFCGGHFHVFVIFRRPFRSREHPRTICIIGARGTADVFHPAPFAVVDVLDAFDIRN